ncbi:hypothetical protein TELCIR_07912 [Teladorsagia circumcincta]|uniref:Uncharacterized protein n=1 Tax=Teladorsagia circumcincta TaxID=45464 RepID=A0A2G9UL77_TELCI|nr:hypothetical protein TELCIR_07912 [Teladorsagia circumcincta]
MPLLKDGAQRRKLRITMAMESTRSYILSCDPLQCFDEMSHLLWNVCCELVRGCLDAFRGLAFVWQLDRDEEYVVVNNAPRAAPRTVMQQRRELRGTVARPAERIYRRRERVWKRIGCSAAVDSLIVMYITK